MSKFTIDNLLAEKRAGHDPDLFSSNDDAFSAQPPVSTSFTSDVEIEKMAKLLRTADVADPRQEFSFNERVAAALILNEAIQSFTKQASENSTPPSPEASGEYPAQEKKEKKEDDKEQEKKAEHFIKSAKAQGYSDEEVCDFLEKQAKMNPGSQKAIKGALVAAGLLGTGVASHEVGKKKGKKEVAERAAKAIPDFYRAGLLKGYRAGKAAAEGKV